MPDKPKHLSEPYAAQWEDACMAEDYPHRPPYPDAVFDLLVGLMDDPSGAVLDLGCGTGDLARPLTARVGRVDGVDRSAAMIARGRTLPRGARVRWQAARAEEARFDPPYQLVTAGESLHWLDWATILPRLRDWRIALVWREERPPPWEAPLRALVPHYSTNTDFEAYDLRHELRQRDLFRFEGEARTEPVPFAQPLAAYVRSFHSRNGFSRARMAPAAAKAFDREVAQLVAPHCRNGLVRLDVRARVCWGAAAPGPA